MRAYFLITKKRVFSLAIAISSCSILAVILLRLEPKRIHGYCDIVRNQTNAGLSLAPVGCSEAGKYPAVLEEMRTPVRYSAVQVRGSLLSRVQTLNDELCKIRSETFSSSMEIDGYNHLLTDAQWELSRASADDRLNLTRPRLVALPWDLATVSGGAWSSLSDRSNLLVRDYHQWTADDPLCTWIETPGTIKLRYDVVFNRTCRRNQSESVAAQSMSAVVLNVRPISREEMSYPDCSYTHQPPFTTHVYVVHNVIVTVSGDAYSPGIAVVLGHCSCGGDPLASPGKGDASRFPLYHEVFSISQYWGDTTFHRMVEEVPRIALFLDFLKRNPDVRIHASEAEGRTPELVEILGLDRKRLVVGTVRARIAYLPRSTPCGMANVPEVQVLSMLYRKYIVANFPSQPRRRLILVRRSGMRRFTEQSAIERILADVSRTSGLDFVVFNDNPVPGLNETMRLFHSAVMVVAPHGAGLSNIVFSRPGTYVVEGVCNLPHVNFCFQHLAYVLGHRWHGVPSINGCEGVVNVPAERIRRAVVSYLRQFKASKAPQSTSSHL